MYLERYESKQHAHSNYLFSLTSFHNKLKTVYLKGKVNRRIDFLVHVLLRIEQDNFFNYSRKCQYPISSQKVDVRHQRAMNIPEEKVKVCVIHF